jgi:eukaryotic-like serine/threonine-protein kinase
MAEGIPFGPYTIVRRLAVGGMAELFLARRSGEGLPDQLIAIKRVLPSLSSDTDFLEMFLDEARLGALLSHPYIVRIDDVGREQGLLYMAMEYVHGVDLTRVLEARRQTSRPFPWPIAVRLINQVCEALQYAHRLTDADGGPLWLVHRDVNPTNVMVTFAGSIKLVDFGIARAASRIHQTEPGVIKGKLEYASPEQYRDEPVDVRTDVYGAALTLYELLADGLPFRKGEPGQVMRAVLSEVPPLLNSVRREIPRRLSDSVAAALSKDPRARPGSVEELRLALAECLMDARVEIGLPEIATFIAQLFPGSDRIERARPEGRDTDERSTDKGGKARSTQPVDGTAPNSAITVKSRAR